MKRKRKIQLTAGLIMVIFITGLAGWSVWFGNNHAQTGFQFMKTVAREASSQNSSAETVFLGDSLTAREDWNVLLGVNNIFNAGISGNTTKDILNRLDPIIENQPKKIFLMIGINDLLKGENVGYILDNYKTIIDRIKSHSPQTLIYIETVLPINNDMSQLGKIDDKKIDDLNLALEQLAKKESITFINLYSSFCGEDHELYAKYTKDGVHLNAIGYETWKSLIVPYIN